MMSLKWDLCWERGRILTTSSTGVTSGRSCLHYTLLVRRATLRLWRYLLPMELILIKVMGSWTEFHCTMHPGGLRWWNTWSKSSNVALVSNQFCVFSWQIIVSLSSISYIISLFPTSYACTTDLRDKRSRTLLHLACIEGSRDVIQYLVEELKMDVGEFN